MMNGHFFRQLFRAAALYNIAAGLTTIVAPQLFFRFFGLSEINHPFVMRGLGLFVALYGYGFYLVSADLHRNRHFALIGLAGKSCVVIGWIYSTAVGEIPLAAAWMSFFNDLVWIPFFLLYFHWLRRQSGSTAN